ncbi:IucA/IucC family protein [Acinetobacter baumannii]|uniref:IucA/IucC family protein n=1 Tax=Acinetobacter baumannii TaxID=470 RepID=UPI000449D469|nr:IucA/IucC family protein [Acinetobacter baumannii]EXA60689.1 ferric iron reductase FhuF-like transporter family protein [Acinetobacter baumannii 1035119]MDC5041542.1 siderophore biosynthesis protein [Acinetobacter baumannii]CAA0276913.1 aerobactin Synthetase IucA [Acinetobacter baumannii]
MQELANRLAIQNFVNAYMQETGKGYLLSFDQQSSTQQAFSSGLTLLTLPLPSIQAECSVPLSYVSRVGRHRLSALPKMCIDGQWQKISAGTIVSLLLEELVIESQFKLDAASLLEKWIQSRDALLQFLKQRHNDFDDLVKAGQDFIESEQALILGHSMHPAPKSRNGFVHEDWLKFSPEHAGKTQLHYWLVHQNYIAEGCATEQPISDQVKDAIRWYLSESDLNLLKTHVEFKLLPLHPWQARYLQGKPWFEQLKQTGQLIDIGLRGWQFSPTTSIRTLASFNAPWMVKTSLSVMITNSIRVNLAKECHRGEISYRLWHSDLGKKILKQCPTLKAVNDPAWIALQIDGEIINETICIFRDQPFAVQQQVTCIASLCQDHPNKELNRFNALFDQIAQKNQQTNFKEIALDWFDHFLKIGLAPLMYVYHKYGMAFESHQQNVLLELEDGLPKNLWLRDNQGFYYIEEFATEIVEALPDLLEKAHAVGPKDFVDERFSYYFFGNTLFGLINAIGATGYISEDELLIHLQQNLLQLLEQYPDSTLLQGLLFNDSLPYKGNLLTRLHELDELIAPLEHQSVYVQLPNPLYVEQKDVSYA